MAQTFFFEIVHRSKKSRARVGRIHTPHGIIDTPAFVPVGTNAALKSLTPAQLSALDVQLMFANTYHLMVQPGAEVVEAAGGIHTFMQRTAPIITDSGGFQVFSLAYGGVAQELKSQGTKRHGNSVAQITEEGVTFRSYKDGTKLLLSPERSIAAQKQIGADIMVAFDELPPYHISPRKLKSSFDRTHRWEIRSLQAHQKNPTNQALYAVIHGGIDPELRAQSARILGAHPFDGFGIGGSVGKNHTEMITMLTQLMPHLPEQKPIHLLGMGDQPAIQAGIPLGIDTFDSAYPTKCARHGVLFSQQGTVRIARAVNAREHIPIEEDCQCYTCSTITRSYLHHLYKAHELAYYSLATIHNVHYMMELMKRYRTAILNDLL